MKILIYPNLTKNNAQQTTQAVQLRLEALGFTTIVEPNLFKACQNMENIDLVAAIGGDGTMLSIAEKTAEYGVPLLGINTGNIGYMTEIEPNELDLLERLQQGDYKIEKRFMIEADVIKSGKHRYNAKALNEILVCRGIVSKMINTTLTCDGAMVCEYRSDGMIIATPTGSTAYSLSAGGPIIDPTMELFVVSTICPHAFNSGHSVVYSPDSALEIKVYSEYSGDIYLTADGSNSVKLYNNDIVCIKRSQLHTKLIRLKENSFYNTLHKKLSGR